MGIINDLKNVFFGASSVTKSASEKAGDFVKEEGEFLLDKTKDFAENAGEAILEKTSGLKDSILDNSSDLLEKTKQKMDDLTLDFSESEIGSKINTTTHDIGEKVLTTGDKLMNKAGEISENVGEVVIDKGGVLLEKSKDISENVGSKVLDAKDKMLERAGEVKDQLSEKLEDTMDKADAWVEHEKANPKPQFAEDTLDASGSLLEGKDDFFSKADKFAGGDYGAFSEGNISVDSPESLAPAKEFEALPPATGFDDLDGDGNEIIDDAIIEE